MITVGQFVARQTQKHRYRYNKLLGPAYVDYPGWATGERPEHRIPGRDHSFAIGPFLISRPYAMYSSVTRQLVEFCDQYDLAFEIQGMSSWHPMTVTVLVWREDWWAEFWRAAQSHGDAFEASVNQHIARQIHGRWAGIKEKGFRHEIQSGIWVSDTRQSRHGAGRSPHGSKEIGEILTVAAPYSGEWEG